ncbi:MAG: hypothetical protein AB7U73_02860 [Pirellulales bacterium]
MSVDTFAFLRDDRLPTIEQWQDALARENLDIVLENVGGLREHIGYLPATHRGQQSGFEWFYGSIADVYGDPAPSGLGDRQHAIDCVTHSDMRELVCAMLSLAVLAQLADGLVYDEESNELISGQAALKIAREIEADSL